LGPQHRHQQFDVALGFVPGSGKHLLMIVWS
jgi:hypothetical protein